MEFIDLKAQQLRIKEQLSDRISTVLDHGRYVMGPEVSELEEKLVDYVGAKHCVSVSSGTDALMIALMALEIGAGDEVITVPYTWISTAEVISLVGAKPVFVDITEDTWNLDPALLEAAITPKTKAIIPVGIFGQSADLTEINQIAEKYALPVIEDAAQCFGATHHGKKACSQTLFGCTSFFPSKPLGGYGDGGAIFTSDDEMAEKIIQIRNHGQKEKHRHELVGMTGRLDTLQAAILLPKLEIFDDEIEKRQQVADAYISALKESSLEIEVPVVSDGNTSVWAQFTILSKERDQLAAALKEKDIPSVSYYAVPLHLQPVYEHLGYKEGDFPNAEKVATQGLSLPMNPYLSEQEIEEVCAALRAIVKK